MPKTKTNNSELLRKVAAGLRTAATRPNIYGYKPHAKQIDFHSSPSQTRLFLGGNRSGKTVGGATEVVFWLTGKHPYLPTPPPPVRMRAISVDFLNGVAKIIQPEIARWIPPSELKGGSWSTSYDKELRVLTLENGSTLEFMSYDQDLEKFAGTSRHGVWFDEEPPHDIYVENLLRTLDVRGKLWITMTPVEGMTWTYDDLYVAARTDPNIHVVEVDTAENTYLNQGELEAFLSTLSDDEKEARVHGQYVQIGGLIYKAFNEANIIDYFKPPQEWLHVASMDHGLNNPTAWLWAAIDPEGRVFVYDEHYQPGRIVREHAQIVHAKNAEHGRIPDYYVGDPSIRNTDPITGTSVQLEYVEHGIPVMPGNNDVHAGINRVARYIEGRRIADKRVPWLYVTRNCVNLIHELSRYRWSTWATKRHNYEKNKKEEPHKKDDHAADALRYLIASRPSMQDATTIPENVGPKGAPVAVDPYAGRVDPVWTRPRSAYVDPVMGEEF